MSPIEMWIWMVLVSLVVLLAILGFYYRWLGRKYKKLKSLLLLDLEKMSQLLNEQMESAKKRQEET